MKVRIGKQTIPTFAAACAICFAASYLSEITLGAVSTLPFLPILPAIAYIIHGNRRHVVGLCTISAFITKCIFTNKISQIILFTLFCATVSFVSATFVNGVMRRRNNKSAFVLCSATYIAVFIIYFLIYGTFWGNVTSKRVNESYLSKQYPQESFAIGATYYSIAERRYVTQADFTNKERYRALISANSDGTAPIDGYSDMCKNELLNVGLKKLQACLSTYAYSGKDFAVRSWKIDSDDVISAETSAENYTDKMCFEIALYERFDNSSNFESACQGYINHLNGFNDLVYKKIRFYGLDTSKNNGFAYALDYEPQNGNYQSLPFDKNEYNDFNGKAKKYWSLIG